MKHILKNLTIAAALVFSFASCKRDDPKPDVPESKHKERTILVYAVASNNLDYDLVHNKAAMLKGMADLDLDKYQILVYEVNNKDKYATLWKTIRNKQMKVVFDSVGSYDRNTFSTDPERIFEVMRDVRADYPSDNYDLFLWSHATSWLPAFSGNRSVPVKRSFGIDNFDGKQDKTDITELSAAIPSGMFDMIWFDCCLMSNIECAYELKDKCEWLAAYPTEIYSEGTPYEKVLPHLFRSEPDREGALKEVYDFYTYGSGTPRAVSVCLMDMKKIMPMAEACKKLYAGDLYPSEDGLLKYSRPQIRLSEEMYDFGQYSIERAKLNGMEDAIPGFRNALEDFVVYKAISDRDFNGKEIDKNNFSGISSHLYKGTDSENDAFYRTLGWYKAVY